MKKYQNILLSFSCAIIVFSLNFIVPSQINGFQKIGFNKNFKNLINNSYAEDIFNFRYNNPVFSKRPFILESQKFLNEYLHVPFQFSFNLLNFIFIICIFFILSKCDFMVNKQEPRILRFTFLFSMPILFAFFASMSTYDDFVQYLFLLIFLLFLFKEKHLISIIFFILACISRETSFIFYIIILPFLFYNVKKNRIVKFITWLLPIIIYFGFLNLYLNAEQLNTSKNFLMDRRFYAWQSNFRDWNSIRESTTILFIMLFPYLFLLYKKIIATPSAKIKMWCKIAALLIVTNALMVMTTGLIRETRLMFIPLLFILPFLQVELNNISKHLLNHLRNNIPWKSIILAGLIAFLWYTTRMQGTGYFYKLYIFAFLIIVFEVVHISSNSKKPITT